jgi:hypothetical protein
MHIHTKNQAMLITTGSCSLQYKLIILILFKNKRNSKRNQMLHDRITKRNNKINSQTHSNIQGGIHITNKIPTMSFHKTNF